MGLFGKEGCGVSYLGNSLQGIELPFKAISKQVSKPSVDFSKYNCVFIQGSNPLAQMPDSNRVKKSFESSALSIYFGLYENETSRAADLVIPAKTFLEKNDFRSSYGDYTFQEMPQLHEGDIGISEYELTKRLCDTFGIAFESEANYLDFFRRQIDVELGVGYRYGRPNIPYEEGFSNGEFEFLEEIDLGSDTTEGFSLITPKNPKALNSQFKRPSGVYVHPEAGFDEGEILTLSSAYGKVEMIAHYDTRLRRDCILIYSGTPYVNVLTSSLLSYEGESAVYQETKIKVTKK
jgi:anaerobic selenocysteine-containing dehydrogenase